MKKTATALSALVIALTCTTLSAQDKYPLRPVTLIVPQAPGGANDAIARVLAQKLQVIWGVSIVIDNKAGAAGVIAAVPHALVFAAGQVLIQCEGWALRGVQGRRADQDRDALPA